ncbi:hypothetical protein BGZ75_006461 [Mortierella antarctica]|uniref:TM2 domain-containing protein n=1 Tax=Mortierella alpina TaxID=64518 RepID=A0A9P8ABQ6_MORAP|nr:hypothetical protein BGZ67_007314 [Mortierella alpina]KAF9982166.1 hypothetical protein BGZ75_006461 [Mortierella antarctica]KAG9326381.1 hypothetical protein KVV02_008001 [Mortierella alpina]
MSSNRRDEESQHLLNGQAVSHAEANNTFYGRTFSHVTHHRKRYFALWLLAAVAAISTVLGLHYYHHNNKGGHATPGEGEFFSNLLTNVTRPDTCKSDRSYPIAILVSIFFGYLGIDRFYLGYIITGLLKLATAGGFGIWYVVDIVLICIGGLPDHNGCRLVAP